MKRAFVVAALVAGCAHEAPQPAAAPAPIAQPAPPPKQEALDEMKVAGTLGSLDEDEIAGPFQRRWDDITRCYDAVAGKQQYLGGKIEVKLRVTAAGDPKSAFVVASTFGNYDAERCVLAIARELHFAKPHGGGEAEFTYPIEFRARRPVQAWEEARISPSVQRHRGDVRACKDKAQGGLPPSLSMTVYVAPGGKIASAGLAADAPLDDAFALCLVGKTKGWRLDDPLGKIAKATVGVGE
ncbi:MAG TPA: TonB family protein [Polyangia bacterium]|nr:TonB family protein [Polyangia bacterium]